MADTFCQEPNIRFVGAGAARLRLQATTLDEMCMHMSMCMDACVHVTMSFTCALTAHAKNVKC